MLVTELHLDNARLVDCCRRFGVARLEVFGSFARGDAKPESDLDVLVTFLPNSKPGLEYIAFALELEAIVGRKVDLLSRKVVETCDNPWFKSEALGTTREIYHAPAA